MRFGILAGLLAFTFSIGAWADAFSIDCDEMRSTIASLSSSLATMNSNSLMLAIMLEKNASIKVDPSYNKPLRELADSIDSLTAKVNKSCK